jgi:hypothetical protein
MLIDYMIHRGGGNCPLKYSKEENATIQREYLISSASGRASQQELQSQRSSLLLASICSPVSIATTACCCSESTHCSPDLSLPVVVYAQHNCLHTTQTDDDDPPSEENATRKERFGPAACLVDDTTEELIVFTLKIPGRQNRVNQTTSWMMPSDWKGRFERLASLGVKKPLTKKPNSVIRSMLTERRLLSRSALLLRSISDPSSRVQEDPFFVVLAGPPSGVAGRCDVVG